MGKRNGIAAEDDEMLDASEVNDWWCEKVRTMGADVTSMPMRIAKRLPHLPAADLAAIVDEFAQLVAGWGPRELH
jgi:hypothetical protein